MKYLPSLLALIIIMSAAFYPAATNQDISLARVDKKQNMYIFIMSEPVAEYEYLGSEKKTVTWTGQPDELFNSVMKKVKKRYPEANGIIFTTMDMDKVDVIRLKEN